MKLGIALGHWGRDARLSSHSAFSNLHPLEAVEKLKECESYGCDSVWVPESYHAEAFTYLSWIGANTKRLQLGTHIVPIQGRTPVLLAQTATTLDHLSGGRVIVGVGVTGLDVAESWHGVPYNKPIARTREYLSVMRSVLEGRRPDNVNGEFYPLPVRGGISKRSNALKPTVRPYRTDLPITIGAMGPKNIALAAEIADGWNCAYLPLGAEDHYRQYLNEGFAKPGARRTWSDFIITVGVATVVDQDLERAASFVRGHIAHGISEMGTREHNPQYDLWMRAGFDAEATRIRDLWFDGQHDAAAAAVPLAMVDSVALVGSKARIRDHLQRRMETMATTLIIRGNFDAVRTVAETGLFEAA